jgi:hypothetical protein
VDVVGDRVSFRPGVTFGVGSLPHRSVVDALDFVWSTTAVPTIPSLPRRSPAEAMVAQALVSIDGVSVGQYGGISVDTTSLSRATRIAVDLAGDALGGFAAFLDSFADRDPGGTDVVKWQFVGPVTLGTALVRVGVSGDVAYPLALRAVRENIAVLTSAVEAACGDPTQIVVVDEPSLGTALESSAGFDGESAVDLVSGALAAVPSRHVAGVHCCARTDWGALLATGAALLSVPVPVTADARDEMTAAASRIAEHLEHGGRIAWGVVRTDAPVAASPERPWKNLMEAMCALVRAGVDPLVLRRRSMLSPACGLAAHSDALAGLVMSHVSGVGERVRQQATLSRLTLGS